MQEEKSEKRKINRFRLPIWKKSRFNKINDYNYNYFPPPKELYHLVRISLFLEGYFKKKTLFQYVFPISAGIFLVFLLASDLLFAGTYNLAENTISDLGNPLLNPDGWIFFSIGFLFLAGVFFPFGMFVYQRLRTVDTFLSKFGFFANLTSSGGMVMLALFPNIITTLTIHIIAAVLSFGGIIIGGIFYWIIILKDAIIRKSKNRVLAFLGMSFMVLIGITITQLIDFITFNFKTHSEAFSVWEWILFFTVGTQTFLLFYLIRDRIVSSKMLKKIALNLVKAHKLNVDISRFNKIPSINQIYKKLYQETSDVNKLPELDYMYKAFKEMDKIKLKIKNEQKN